MIEVSSGLLGSTWVLGWYVYHLWLNFCGFFYQFIGSFLEALGNKDWRYTLHDRAMCESYIQDLI